MDARDFLTIADQFNSAPSEAERRTSIGRSYYALFNVILGTLAAKGVAFHGNAKDHQDLIGYLGKMRSDDVRNIGQVLGDLRAQRNVADYKMNNSVPVKTSQFVYAKAKSAIEKFDAISSADLKEIARQIQTIP